MTWNAALIDAPIAVPIWGEPNEEGAREVLGYVAGYHVNIAPHLMSEALQAYRVDPTPGTPVREFAGAETAFLRFEDEAEAQSVLGAYWSEDPNPS